MASNRRDRAARRVGRYHVMCDLIPLVDVKIARDEKDPGRLWHELAVEHWPRLAGMTPEEIAYDRVGYRPATVDDRFVGNELIERAEHLLDDLPNTPDRVELENRLRRLRSAHLTGNPDDEEYTTAADHLRQLVEQLEVEAYE